jgi:LPXTG-motif cell wall-anchored protein
LVPKTGLTIAVAAVGIAILALAAWLGLRN